MHVASKVDSEDGGAASLSALTTPAAFGLNSAEQSLSPCVAASHLK